MAVQSVTDGLFAEEVGGVATVRLVCAAWLQRRSLEVFQRRCRQRTRAQEADTEVRIFPESGTLTFFLCPNRLPGPPRLDGHRVRTGIASLKRTRATSRGHTGSRRPCCRRDILTACKSLHVCVVVEVDTLPTPTDAIGHTGKLETKGFPEEEGSCRTSSLE